MPVRAHIHTVGGLSAHADQGALLGWLSGFSDAPGETFLAFLVCYGIGRFLLERLRGDDDRGAVGALSTSTLIAVASILCAGLLWVALRRRHPKVAPATNIPG